jgi:hypothetical protein
VKPVQRIKKRQRGSVNHRKSEIEDSFSINSSKPSSVYDAYYDNDVGYGEFHDQTNGYDESEYIMDEDASSDFVYGNAEGHDDNADDDQNAEIPTPIVTLNENININSTKSSRPLPKLMRATPGHFLNKASFGGERSSSASLPDMSVPNFSLTGQLFQVQTPGGSGGVKKVKSEGSGSGSEQGGNYPCDICGKVFSHHRSMNDHKKMHTGDTRCPICQKTFSKVANLRAHYKAQHLDHVGVSLESVRGNILP